MPGLTLDAGALIAFERNDRQVVGLLAQALAHGLTITVPAGVVGQVWRDGRRQARLARLLGAPDVVVEPLDDQRARDRIASSDDVDLVRLDPTARIIRV